MIGIDTNILVRLLTNDDKAQAKYAAHLIENNVIFIPKTVLLETEWVLRYTYNLPSSIIFDSFEKLLGLANVTVEDPASISQTLEWYANNLDFADALHLASSHSVAKFATLDKQLIKKAVRANIPLMTL